MECRQSQEKKKVLVGGENRELMDLKMQQKPILNEKRDTGAGYLQRRGEGETTNATLKTEKNMAPASPRAFHAQG